MPRTVRRSPRCAFAWKVGALMQQASFGSVQILHPELLQMDQCPLPWTEHQMLQGADRQAASSSGVESVIKRPRIKLQAKNRYPLFYGDTLGHGAVQLNQIVGTRASWTILRL